MKTQAIELIPIAQIRVVNPRSRNKHTFSGIINNIRLVGLKKPITVFRRTADDDGTQYDLVCGQGRMEAIAALGGSKIPAIVTDAPKKQRYLMSLIENVARKRPPHSDLLEEIRGLRKQGCSKTLIGKKLGLGHTYIDGILHLLEKGEDRLVEQVAAGAMPLSIAVRIATAGNDEVQTALATAYSNGEIRGAKLRSVQRLIVRRAAERKTGSVRAPRLTGPELIQEYELESFKQRELIKRASLVHERLAILSSAMRRLLADANFLKVLREEGLDSMPEQLAARLR